MYHQKCPKVGCTASGDGESFLHKEMFKQRPYASVGDSGKRRWFPLRAICDNHLHLLSGQIPNPYSGLPWEQGIFQSIFRNSKAAFGNCCLSPLRSYGYRDSGVRESQLWDVSADGNSNNTSCYSTTGWVELKPKSESEAWRDCHRNPQPSSLWSFSWADLQFCALHQ